MIATKTLDAIAAAVEAEQDDEPRSHLGASVIGGPCDRAGFYDFRWTKTERFDARKLRLFERGNREEDVFVELLQKAGLQVFTIDPNTGKQFVASGYKGHVGGSTDAFIFGCADIPAGIWANGEFKTHNEKSFDALLKDGLCASKPEHFAQCQKYMEFWGLDYCLYCAVCKNDDRLHIEVVRKQAFMLDQLSVKERLIVDSKTPPPRGFPKASHYRCKWCVHRRVCWFGEAPNVNCRTCQFSKPVEGGKWHCLKYDAELSKAQQLTACQSYQLNTTLNQKP